MSDTFLKTCWDKIMDIRLDIPSHCQDPSIPSLFTSILSQFEPVTLPVLQNIVSQLKPSASSYVTLPPRFFKHIFEGIGPTCHESGSWASLNSPPEVTRSPHGLLHYTHCCTPPQTTIPITHCTDDTRTEHTADCTQHTADCTQHTADCSEHTADYTDHTTYLNHGLPVSLCRVLFSI